MRKTIIAGNWKMNKTNKEAAEILKELKGNVEGVDNVGIIIGVPFTALQDSLEATNGSNVMIAAQNMHWEANGAYTGEISPEMLTALGVEYVIIGHSERREYFAETDEIVNKKVKAALANDLTPIVCVGEKLEDREAGNTEKVVQTNVKGAFDGLTKDEMLKVIIAYEPIWAIGTGKTASPEQAEEVHKFIRGLITDMYDAETAQEITIQYGGSMKPGNAKELLAQEDIDGGLVGGASLKPSDFTAIIKSAL